jgi:protein SCO1/2
MKTALLSATLAMLAVSSPLPAQQHEHGATHDHAANQPHHTSLMATDVNYQDSLYHLDNQWHSHRKQALQLNEFAGQPVLISMIYGSCRTACPLLVLDAKHFVEQLPAPLRQQVQVVFVSFDHQRDKPQALADYAQQVGAMADNWHFLHGQSADIRSLAALLGIRYRQNDEGNFDHSNVLTLLDQQGRIVWRTEGLRQDPTAGINAAKQLGHF